MNYIVNGNMWKRLGARLIDFVIVFLLSFLLFFTLIYPNTFDSEAYKSNLDELGREYDRSQLYIRSSKDNLYSKGASSRISKIEDLYSVTEYLDEEEFADVRVTESLVNFYCNLYSSYGKQNLTFDVFNKQVLDVDNPESNIKELLREEVDGEYNYKYILKDESLAEVIVVDQVLNCYSKATQEVANSARVVELTNKNNSLMNSSLLLIIPTIVGFSFIFDLIIPLCLDGGQSIGKKMFKLEIISKEGYQLNKIKLLPRWLSYVIIDLFLGFVTMFGSLLISYTMMVFNKRGMVIHDYISGTMVVDKELTIRFKNAEEERRFKERQGTVGL